MIKYIRINYFPDDSDIYREIEKYHMVDHDGYQSIYDYPNDIDQQKVTTPSPELRISLVGNNSNVMEDNSSDLLAVTIDGGFGPKKSSTLKSTGTNKFNSFKLTHPMDGLMDSNNKSNTYSHGDAKKFKMNSDYNGPNITNLDQLMQSDDLMDTSGVFNYDSANTIDMKHHHSYSQSEASGPPSKILLSLSGASEEDDHSSFAESYNILSPLTPLTGVSQVFPNSSMTLDAKRKTMSIRSARRAHHMRQGTSADGQAMSVIFMDNNEEYVNTGFAFAFNDENEISNRRTRRNNPLFKAKSVDEIYERRRKRRHQKMSRKNSTIVARRPSQPDTSYY